MLGLKCAHTIITIADGTKVKYESCISELQSQVAIQAYTLFFLNIVELILPSVLK